jgi:hypothetical protein
MSNNKIERFINDEVFLEFKMGFEEFLKDNKGCIFLDEEFIEKFSSFLDNKRCGDFLEEVVSRFENPSTRQVEEYKFMTIKPKSITVRLGKYSSEEYNKTMAMVKNLVKDFQEKHPEYNQKYKKICVDYIV